MRYYSTSNLSLSLSSKYRVTRAHFSFSPLRLKIINQFHTHTQTRGVQSIHAIKNTWKKRNNLRTRQGKRGETKSRDRESHREHDPTSHAEQDQ